MGTGNVFRSIYQWSATLGGSAAVIYAFYRSFKYWERVEGQVEKLEQKEREAWLKMKLSHSEALEGLLSVEMEACRKNAPKNDSLPDLYEGAAMKARDKLSHELERRVASKKVHDNHSHRPKKRALQVAEDALDLSRYQCSI